MDAIAILMYIFVFMLGAVIGSFLNVCILRIPAGESIVTGSSHCPKCGERLKWYELIPIFSFLALRGRCKSCKAPISAQYPLIEAVNGVLFLLAFERFGLSPEALTGALLFSALLALSVIDERTQEIPNGFCLFILVLALCQTALDFQNRHSHVIGLFAVSLPLALIFFISRGRALGGGDVKLMAVCGLYLGWGAVLGAFFLGCLLGAVIHLLRMKLSGKNHVLALGPYLSAGVFLVLVWGEALWSAYLSLFI